MSDRDGDGETVRKRPGETRERLCMRERGRVYDGERETVFGVFREHCAAISLFS